VRIEAGRLRRSLEHYYLTAGAGDAVRIVIPKGTYAPAFETVGAPAHTESSHPVRALNRHGPVIVVQPFGVEGDDGYLQTFSRSLVRQIIVGLTRFGGVFVCDSDYKPEDASAQLPLRQGIRPDFILSGTVAVCAERIVVDTLLLDTEMGQYAWAEKYDRPYSEDVLTTVGHELSDKIVQAIAQPHGAIFRDRARSLQGKPLDDYSPFDSVVMFRKYTQTYSKELVAPLFFALNRTLQTDPQFAEAHACLARLCVDIHRFRFDGLIDVKEPLDHAMSLARRAVELAPDAGSSHHALAAAFWFKGDVAASLDAYSYALELNPNDAELLGEAGARHAAIADWDRALPLLKAAFERNPFQPSTYRVALSLCHLAHARYADSLAEARKAIAPDVPYGHMLVAAAAGHLGYWREAIVSVEAILKIDPNYWEHAVADLAARNVHPSLIRVLANGLAKAGVFVDIAALAPHEISGAAIGS
jgi:TolB-like protein